MHSSIKFDEVSFFCLMDFIYFAYFYPIVNK